METIVENYNKYTEISLNAFEFNPRSKEIIEKKKEINDTIIQYHGSKPTSVLFYGFNPMILSLPYTQISVTHINDRIKNLLDRYEIKYTYIDSKELNDYSKEFSWVVAADEFFTFADSEETQRRQVTQAVKLAKTTVITTLKDYKNQEFKEREFSQPLAIYNQKVSKVFLEYHNYDFEDKNAWNTTVYELTGQDAIVHGAFSRRSMYFKQLARFSMDAGASNFYVHKNLMYKGLIKKNYEHVLSINV